MGVEPDRHRGQFPEQGVRLYVVRLEQPTKARILDLARIAIESLRAAIPDAQISQSIYRRTSVRHCNPNTAIATHPDPNPGIEQFF